MRESREDGRGDRSRGLRAAGTAFAIALAALVAIPALPRLRAQDGARPTPSADHAGLAAGESELSPEARACLDGALRWLAHPDHQGEDGAVRGDRSEAQEVASTALAGLAWLASGSSQNRGPYASDIEKALQYLLKNKRPGPGGFGLRFHDHDRPGGRMHAHGFATLFLAELYGMARGGAREERAKDLHDVLRAAVRLSVRSQTTKGGWGYNFAGEDLLSDEASTTITQIQALRAARNAGIEVPNNTIEDAIKYVRASMRGTKPAGSARYALTGGPGGDRTSFELTAAAVATLNASGVYRSPELDAGLACLRRFMSKKENRLAAAESYYFYGNLYAAQAMFQSGGDDWNAWFKDAQADLIAKARRRGDLVWWEDPRSFGDAYATASACLILEIPLRYLPIFER